MAFEIATEQECRTSASRDGALAVIGSGRRESILRLVVIGVIAGLLAGLLNYVCVRWFEGQERAALVRSRTTAQGIWVLETTTTQTSLSTYNDLKIVHVVSLTVDNSLNVRGVAYKWREHGPKDYNHVYERAQRTRAEVTGAIVDGRLSLQWESSDASGRGSLQVFEGSIVRDSGAQKLTGTFWNDVAAQAGHFCGRKVSLEQIEAAGITLDPCR